MIKTKNLFDIFFSSQIANYLLILFSFFLTISTSISSIIIGLLFLNFLFFSNKKNKIILKNKVAFSIILFFTFIIISSFWFQKNTELIDLNSSFIYELNKNWILLFCPLLIFFQFDLKTKKRCKYAFIAGLIFNVFLGILIYFNENFIFLAKTGHYINESYLHGFLDHSDLSILFCFGIFIVLEELFQKKELRFYLIIILILLLLFLFNSYGRTGIICFIISLPVFFYLKYSFKLKFFWITFMSMLIIIIGFSFSTSLSARTTNTINEIHDLLYGVSLEENIHRHATYMANQDSLSRPIEHWERRIKSEKNEKGDLIWINHIKKSQNETSLSKRLNLWNMYIKKIKENKLLGKGLGSITELKKSNTKISDDPHNYYLFVLTEFGIIGLLLFLNIFITIIIEFIKSKKENTLQIIFPIIFLCSLFINDYLFIYNTLAFFGLFSYLLYSNNN